MNGSIAPPSPFEDEEDPPVFILRNGQVWACWLGGRAPVALGAMDLVCSAMQTFLRVGQSPPESKEKHDPPVSSSVQGVSELHEPEAEKEEAPRETRHDLSILERLYTGIGVRDVTILDLSAHGCRFHDRFCNLRPGMPVSVRIGPVGPMRSVVRWRRGEYVGVQFENALYPSVLEHIRTHFNLPG